VSEQQATAAGPVDLDEVQQICDAAMPEPWVQSPNAADAVITLAYPLPADVDTAEHDYGGFVVGESMHPSEVAFVVAARTLLPRLATELRAAREGEPQAEQRAREIVQAAMGRAHELTEAAQARERAAEARIGGLRQFEADYRAQLHDLIQGHLDALDDLGADHGPQGAGQ
jgi:hypothetical protein